MQDDQVNHPKHYTSHPSGIQCIQITKWHDFCIGNVIKYCWRAGLKDQQGKGQLQKQIEDLKKARWYLDEEIKTLQEKL